MPRVLHVLSQRPSLTGSGITLDALVRHAASAGWHQDVVVGVPVEDPEPGVGDLPSDRIHPLVFQTPVLPFAVPGMSDVMPYPSTRFSAMGEEQVATYLSAWEEHLARVVNRTRPDVIHAHHVWLMASVLRRVAPSVPVVVHCHATGLRQAELCPDLAARVRAGCSAIDRFAVLHRGHRDELCAALVLNAERVHVVGAGYREELFHARGRRPAHPPRLLYIGKYSAAKGLPCLLDAVEALWDRGVELDLHVAGAGSGPEADALRLRMETMGGRVVLHGQVAQPELAEIARRSAVAVLPSFFEGLPLVLVEAYASGCRLVATALPGIVEQLAPALGDALELVEPPAMAAVDEPVESDLPAFTRRLDAAIERALAAPPVGDPGLSRPDSLAPFTWSAVFDRVQAIWLGLL